MDELGPATALGAGGNEVDVFHFGVSLTHVAIRPGPAPSSPADGSRSDPHYGSARLYFTLERLAALEVAIERGHRTFIEVGLALWEIKDLQLYRATHPSFRAYLINRWGFRQEWAYAAIYNARCAQAIIAEYGALPDGLAPEALRPLWPLRNRQGPDAVAKAWAGVVERYGGRRRAPSRSEVREALLSRGCATIKPERKRVQMGQVGASLETAVAHVARVRKMLRGRPLPPAARRRQPRGRTRRAGWRRISTRWRMAPGWRPG